jgi:hypothetical protein
MKSLYKFLSIFILVILFGCTNGSEHISCFTPPGSFSFQITDKKSGENLFTNGTYAPSQIIITDLYTDKIVAFKFIDENKYNAIVINNIGWKTEKINYSIAIKEKNIFELYVDASRLNKNNCSYTNYNEVKIKNIEFELDRSTGVYKILVE